MKQEVYSISIDVGTTNLKVTLFKQYALIDEQSIHYHQTQLTQQHNEFNAVDIWIALSNAMQVFIEKYTIQQVEIVLTSAMHSVLCLDENIVPLGNGVTWANVLGHEWVDRKHQKFITNYLRTGTPIHSMNPYFKLAHLQKENDSSVRYGSIKDYLMYQLTQQWVIDVSNASSSGLYNSVEKAYDASILKQLNLQQHQLPKVVLGNESFELSESLLERFKLTAAKVYPGYSDGVSSNGAYIGLADAAVLSIGTSHAVRVIQHEYTVDAETMNFCYCIDASSYIVGFPSNNGGNVLEWLMRTYQVSISDIEMMVQQRQGDIPLFFPFLHGERAPLWDAQATASFIDLKDTHTMGDCVNAIVLGMLSNIKMNVQSLQKMATFSKIALSGGFSQSETLCQLLADMLQMPIYVAVLKNIESLGSLQLLHGHFETDQYRIYNPSVAEDVGHYFERYCTHLTEKCQFQ